MILPLLVMGMVSVVSGDDSGLQPSGGCMTVNPGRWPGLG